MPKIISLSEVFHEFTPTENVEVIQFPNRGTGSVFGCLTKLGQEVKLIRAFNNGVFGNYCLSTVQSANEGQRENVKPSFQLHLNDIAENNLKINDLDDNWFESGDILYMCSTDLITESMRASYEKAIGMAWRKHCPIVFNVLLNTAFYENVSEYKSLIKRFIDIADIIVINETDLSLLTGLKDEQEAIKVLLRRAQTVVYSKSIHGTQVYTKAYNVTYTGIFAPIENQIMAHDLFVGAFLSQLLLNQVHGEIAIDKLKMYEILHFSTSLSYRIQLGFEKYNQIEATIQDIQAV